jgi:preprotein translocase subunit SecA
LIYKRESYGLFKKMIENINKEAIAILMRGQIPVQERSQEEVREAAPEKRENTSYQTNRTEEARQPQPQPQRRVVSPITTGPKIGRNDPCPCGSGKKYKHCHGK